MRWISVADAAVRLDVGVSRIHQRIADRSLHAERVGSQWVIEESSLAAAAESAIGRPLSQRSAWALLAAAGTGTPPAALSSTERTRARTRLRRLVDGLPENGLEEPQMRTAAARLRSLLRHRADRQVFRGSPRDLEDMRDDARLTLAGLSDPASGISAGEMVEAYSAATDLKALEDDYLLSPAHPGDRINVVLHVVPQLIVVEVSPLLLAADLAEHRAPREEARAVELMYEVRRNLPARRLK